MRDQEDRIEKKLDEQQKDITAIRQKVFNGFGTTIEEMHKELIELRRLAEKVDRLNFQLVEHRFETCPLRSYLGKRFEKRIYLSIALATFVISTITFVVNLIW